MANTLFGPPDLALLGAAVKWGRVLSAGELALLPTVLGV